MLEESLNERTRRLWAATEAQALGYGGASLVAGGDWDLAKYDCPGA